MAEAIIYPANTKTDKEKLFDCYSLIEQMRLEHNKVVKVARGNSSKYLKTGKFRTYAHESKARLKQLLAEQNRLKENIRWANYTPEQWKAVGKLELREQNAIYQTLFGDRMQERVKTTKATSSLLDGLKALNLDDMPETLGTDPTEDFTTYTEVDEGSDVTKTADRITFTAVENKSDTYYVYKDKGVNHFDGDFEHLCKSLFSAMANYPRAYVWLLANSVGDVYDIYQASGSLLGYVHYYDSSAYQLFLMEYDSGTAYNDSYSGFSLSTIYYNELERDESVGTYGTLYAYICTGDYWDDGGSQVDTLTVALHTSKKDFRYVYGASSYDDASSTGHTATGYIELLDLQEVGWTNISHVKGIAAASISHKKGIAVASISHVKGVAV